MSDENVILEDDETTNESLLIEEESLDNTVEPISDETDGQASDEVSEIEEDNSLEAQAKWYTLQCFALYEHKVTTRIRQMMENEFKDKVFQVLLPEEETVEIKNNKRQERMTKIYPGYIFVKTLPSEEVWFLLRQIPGVSKVIGSKTLPTPIAASQKWIKFYVKWVIKLRKLKLTLKLMK